MKDPSPVRTHVHEARLTFLLTEVETAEVLADIALKSEDREKAIGNTQNARRCYDSLMRYLILTELTEDERDLLTRKVVSLKSKLLELGEKFP